MMSGLEIHQQLKSNRKLFCNCYPRIYKDYEKEIKRTLRISSSEVGTLDKAALYEYKKKKHYIYQFSNEYSCLVELDEEPTHIIDMESLKTAIIISEFFNMHIPNVLQVMRKIVIDGSNTSGFQRTLIVGIEGKITINNKDVEIQTLCLEEDSARIIEKGENYVKYRLDRLGFPLVEITTGPNLNTPEEVKTIAKYIGEVLRLSKRVLRGLGTIRQDINISIEGGEKIELKGVQDLDAMDNIVKKEITRQENILKWQNIVKSRGIEKIELL